MGYFLLLQLNKLALKSLLLLLLLTQNSFNLKLFVFLCIGDYFLNAFHLLLKLHFYCFLVF